MLACGLAAVLILLAMLQYRSVQAVRFVTTEQMNASLLGSLMDVRQGFDRELGSLCNELDFAGRPREQDTLRNLASGFDRWRNASAHPALVQAVYILEQNPHGPARLLKLKSNRSDFEPVSLPDVLARLRDRLTEFPPESGPQPAPDHSDQHPPDSFPPPKFPPRQPGQPQPPPSSSREFDGAADRFGSMHLSPWMVDENIPALIRSISPPPFPGRERERPNPPQWLIIVLDKNVLAQHVLPELIQRYFGNNDTSAYEIGVIDLNRHAPDLYVLDLRVSDRRPADAALNLFGFPVPSAAPGQRVFVPIPPDAKAPHGPTESMNPEPTNDNNVQGPHTAIEPLHYNDNSESDWEIIARHRQGSVQAAVGALARRNLMFNFAVLLVLAATIAVIIVGSLRARRFSQLQMDFVANVSHELRTPLAGIVSAGQNIADSLIDDKEKVSVYGRAIVRQAHQLSELVEQILQFSAGQKGGDRYRLEPLDITEVLADSLKNTVALIESAGVKVEQDLQPGLPEVVADFKALSRCLQNLIGNAAKYGGEAKWIGIRAWLENSNSTGNVCVSISDKGVGIRREEWNHIFEPFYRTADATAAQIHGTGLGLPLAKRVAQAMGGSLTVESEFGRGSTFTLHLPAGARH
jgi:signal transduction histidine kinase